MNLILLQTSDFVETSYDFCNLSTDSTLPTSISGIVKINDQRSQHILTVLKATSNKTLTVGLVNNLIGKATILNIEDSTVTLSVHLTQSPPQKLNLKLVIALPRPKVAKRLIETCTELGAREIHLINAYKVEKSYWQSPLLHTEKIQRQIDSGLQQSKDTVIPQVFKHTLFKPFVEDKLAAIIGKSEALVAHPYGGISYTELGRKPDKNGLTLCIGPEGGFIPYEIECMKKIGCQVISLGSRIFRVETVLPYIIGKIES